MSKRRWIVAVFVCLLGLFPLFNSIGNPRTQALHGSDFVQLIAVGWCFGIGFGVLLGKRRFQGE